MDDQLLKQNTFYQEIHPKQFKMDKYRSFPALVLLSLISLSGTRNMQKNHAFQSFLSMQKLFFKPSNTKLCTSKATELQITVLTHDKTPKYVHQNTFNITVKELLKRVTKSEIEYVYCQDVINYAWLFTTLEDSTVTTPNASANTTCTISYL